MFRKKTPFSGALVIGIAISLSRLFGFFREILFAVYFGRSDVADAFRAAMRIPNFLQNLLGEGTLSASFVPVYTRKIQEEQGLDSDLSDPNKNQENLDKDLELVENLTDKFELPDKTSMVLPDHGVLALEILRILLFVVFILVSVGVFFAPEICAVITPGFVGEKRDLTIKLVRIFFISAGLMVISAWCLGVLNSHKNFFLPYASPIAWNLCIIFGLVYFSEEKSLEVLSVKIAWAVVIGSLVQVLLQLPRTVKLLTQNSKSGDIGTYPVNSKFSKYQIIFQNLKISNLNFSPESRLIIKNFFPVFFSRGIVQISAYIDSFLCSFLATGTLAALSYAQMLYLLPISIFGMSISTAELTSMSEGEQGTKRNQFLFGRLEKGQKKLIFFLVPISMLFIFFGDIIIQSVYQYGRFSLEDSFSVYLILAVFSLSLYASSVSRLYASLFYANKDTKTPFRISLIRVSSNISLALLLVFVWNNELFTLLNGYFGIERSDFDNYGGGVMLAFAASFASLVENLIYRQKLKRIVKYEELKFSVLSDFVRSLVISLLLAVIIKFFLFQYVSSFTINWEWVIFRNLFSTALVCGGYLLSYFIVMKLSEKLTKK